MNGSGLWSVLVIDFFLKQMDEIYCKTRLLPTRLRRSLATDRNAMLSLEELVLVFRPMPSRIERLLGHSLHF
jgi:hypothetical protein